MPTTAVVGLQWGDEGKGKVVDALAADADYIVRYSSGSNAGHTVVVENRRFIFHIVPSGLLHPHTTCLVCQGVAFDPDSFFRELDMLDENGVDYRGRLWVSERAHLVLPLHKLEDEALDRLLGIGTTRRGVGPCYADRAYRLGIRVADLFSASLKERLKTLLEVKRPLLQKAAMEVPSLTRLLSWCGDVARRLEPFVANTAKLVHEALRKDARILLEGAQGVMLDVDAGTYPYVTSCHPATDGISSGCGVFINPDRVIGILKCYTTRVGGGPFPTEERGEAGEILRRRGNEFGATTSRPRRCGWLDMVALKHACRLANPTQLIVTKLDVLSGMQKIKVCTAYKFADKQTEDFPASLEVLSRVTPVYRVVDGWEEVHNVKSFKELPKSVHSFLSLIEEETGTRVVGVSVGVERRQMVEREV